MRTLPNFRAKNYYYYQREKRRGAAVFDHFRKAERRLSVPEVEMIAFDLDLIERWGLELEVHDGTHFM